MEWTIDECAEAAGIKPKTWHAYVARGRAPKPLRHVGRTPVWDADEVQAWTKARPGTPGRPKKQDGEP